MGKGLQDLGLKEEALPTAGQSLADLPEFGSFQPPPQPGTYRFKLPADLSAIYDVYDSSKFVGQQRIRAMFDKDHPLTIVQSRGGVSNGLPYETRISNEERNRGKGGVVASDMDYLLRALGVKEKPATNKAYILALTPMGGKEFSADIRYSWSCSDQRNIRVKDDQGSVQEVPDRKGCGQKYYQEDLPNGGVGVDGKVPYEIGCTCGGLLRAFANLDNIRA